MNLEKKVIFSWYHFLQGYNGRVDEINIDDKHKADIKSFNSMKIFPTLHQQIRMIFFPFNQKGEDPNFIKELEQLPQNLLHQTMHTTSIQLYKSFKHLRQLCETIKLYILLPFTTQVSKIISRFVTLYV